MRAILRVLAIGALGAAAILSTAATAQAGSAWDEIHRSVFGDRAILPAGDLVQLSAPVRPDDQRAVPVTVAAAFADGRTIRSVTLIADENPTPVAAVFDIGGKRDEVKLATTLRLNVATNVRAIVEASDGNLYVVSRFVKFAGGQAACSAPPNGSSQEIAASMGHMTFDLAPKAAAATEINPRATLKVMHPNHTGMVLDQITLLYVPLRIITGIEVRQGDERVLSVKGSIALSQNPVIDFDYRVNGAGTMRVLVNDSDGASWQRSFPIGQGS